MRRTLTGSLLTLATVVVALPAWAVSLELDPSFSDDGVMRWPLKTGIVYDLARDGNQYLAAGNYRPEAGKEALFLARINANGTLDAGYGDDGVATAVLGDAGSIQVAVAPDGTAVTVTRRNKVLLAHRWTSEGELDTSFSADGVRELPFGELHRQSSSLVTVDSQGRVVAAAMIDAPKGDNTQIVRLNPDGSRDPTFGSRGRVTVNLDITDWPDALAVDARDRVLLALDFYQASPGDAQYAGRSAVVRLRQNGAYDRKFSNDGLALFRFAQGGQSYPMDLGVDASGRVVVAAYDYRTAYGAIRLLSNGEVDTTYGHQGKVSAVCECSIYSADVHNGRVAFVANRYLKRGRQAVVARIGVEGTQIQLREIDLVAGDDEEFVASVLVDGGRTIVAGDSLNRPFVARLG